MIYTIKNEYLSVDIADMGAELQSILDADGTEYLWQGEHERWRHRAPILFPSVSWFYKNSYQLDGEIYEMPFNGFAQSTCMQILKHTENRATFGMMHTSETMRMFPYKYQFCVDYQLYNNILTIQYIVQNKDDKTMHFSFGTHPCFNVPMIPELTFDDYYYAFPEGEDVWRVFRKAPGNRYYDHEEPYVFEDGKRLWLNDEALGRMPVLLHHMGSKAILGTDKDCHRIEMEFKDMNLFMIWHMAGVPAVTAEPWTSCMGRDGVVEDLSERTDMIHLEAGDVYVNSMKLKFVHDRREDNV